MPPSDQEAAFDRRLQAFCRSLQGLRTSAGGPTLRDLADDPSVALRRAALSNIFGGKIKRPPEDHVPALLAAIYTYAERQGHSGKMPDRAQVYTDYEELLQSFEALYSRDLETLTDSSEPSETEVLPAVEPLRLVVDIQQREIRLLGTERNRVLARDPHEGAGHRLRTLIEELELERRRIERPEDHPFVPPSAPQAGAPAGGTSSLGRALGRRFFAGSVGSRLRERLARPESVVRLVLRCVDGDLQGLPWEAAVIPGMDASLAAHPHVEFYRPLSWDGVMHQEPIPRPFRVMALVTNPPSGRAFSGFHQRGLAEVILGVDKARRNHLVRVETPNSGEPALLRHQLVTIRHHVLYLTCPVNDDGLLLEDADGRAQTFTPERFTTEFIDPDCPVPFVVLRSFTTESGRDPWPMLIKLTQRLAETGTEGVLIFPPEIAHKEVVQFTSELFEEATASSNRSILSLTSKVRRRLGSTRNPADAEPLLFITESAVEAPLMDGNHYEAIPERNIVFADMPVRGFGDFVGRRAELQGVLNVMRGPNPRLVITGIGGVGKSTLAAQALKILEPSGGLVVALNGRTSPDQILERMAQQFRSWQLAHPERARVDDRVLDGLVNARRSWQDRLDVEVHHILLRVPINLVLDNFEDNLLADGARSRPIRSADLAGFLSTWIRLTDRARLLVTSRFPMALPGQGNSWLEQAPLGPLTMVEARQLAWRLPALDALDEADLRSAVWALGGHPRALELLDALLSGGNATFRDVKAKLQKARQGTGRLSETPERAASLDQALPEAIDLVARDVLLSGLLRELESIPTATELLTRASLYRIPVPETALSWLVLRDGQGAADEIRAARLALADLGLLAEVHEGGAGSPLWIVHPWTAGALQSLIERDDQRVAHQHAADYWLWMLGRAEGGPRPDREPTSLITARLEAAHHLFQAGLPEAGAWEVDRACSELDVIGAYSRILQVCTDALTEPGVSGSAEAIIRSRRGVSAARLARYQDAKTDITEALAIRQALDITDGLAANLECLATLQQLYGHYDEAWDTYRQSLDAMRRSGDRSSLPTINYNLGNLARRCGELQAAGNFYRRGRIAAETNNPDGTLLVETLLALATLPLTAMELSRDGEPMNLRPVNLDLILRSQAPPGAALNANLIVRQRGEYPASEQRRNSTTTEHGQHLQSIAIASGECNLGVIAQALNEHSAAERHYAAAYRILERLRDQGRLPIVIHNQATLAQAMQHLPQARALYRRSREMFIDIHDLAGFSTGYHDLGTLAHLEGQLGDADDAYNKANEFYRDLKDPIGQAGIMANRAAIHMARSDPQTAETLYREAFAVFAQAGDQLSCAAVASSLGLLYTRSARPDTGLRWTLHALAIRSRQAAWNAVIDGGVLQEQHRMLGATDFRTVVARLLPGRDVDYVVQALAGDPWDLN